MNPAVNVDATVNLPVFLMNSRRDKGFIDKLFIVIIPLGVIRLKKISSVCYLLVDIV
jgi:hypothetical protein